jgi:hypothetical protein
VFIVDPQGSAKEVPKPPREDPAGAEMRLMMKKREEERSSRFAKDTIGRLIAIAGLIIVLIYAKGSGKYDIYVVVLGFAISLAGRIIMMVASYEPAKRIQDSLEAGASVFEKISHWF